MDRRPAAAVAAAAAVDACRRRSSNIWLIPNVRGRTRSTPKIFPPDGTPRPNTDHKLVAVDQKLLRFPCKAFRTSFVPNVVGWEREGRRLGIELEDAARRVLSYLQRVEGPDCSVRLKGRVGVRRPNVGGTVLSVRTSA